jgi:hypothetical protein
MHGAGLLLQSTGALTGRGVPGVYWSGTQSLYFNATVNISFISGSCGVAYADKAYGETLRCIED